MDERHGIDIYEPIGSRGPLPNIIFFYGGVWTTGSRAEYRFAGAGLARKGFRVYVPDYRLYHHVSHRDILEDGAAALRFVRAQHPNEPVFLVGHSAGAQIAVLLGALGMEPVDGVVALAAPYQSSMIRSRRRLPPAFLVAADNDAVVPAGNTRRLAIDWSQGGTVTTKIYQKGGHALLVGALSPVLRWTLPVMKDVITFLQPISVQHAESRDEPARQI